MIITYVDSSATMRLVSQEGDVSLVERAMASNPISSLLMNLELHVAIFKRWHDGALDTAVRDRLISITEGRIIPAFTLLPLDAAVVDEARAVATEYSVRTLDALHVGTAVIASRSARRYGSTFDFCTADRRQAEAATKIFGSLHVSFVLPWR
ncbi:MAG: type II toxin-antitoxin system VapC family toxin [Dehalococcoidia bacterium]